jgi:hypothetical protein
MRGIRWGVNFRAKLLFLGKLGLREVLRDKKITSKIEQGKKF